MSEITPDDAPDMSQTVVAPAAENVARGLLAATGAILVGLVLTVVVWRLGFIASITSFAMAAGAVFIYGKAAGADPRRGLLPLIGLIVVGVVLGCAVLVGSDAWDAYGVLDMDQAGVSRFEFIKSSLTDSTILSAYSKDLAFFVGFAVLGTWGTIRRLLAN